MTREQKKNKLVTAAGALAFDLQHDGKAFFGNEGVSVYANGEPGDIIGTLLGAAGIIPSTKVDITDPKEAVALALGIQVADLPEKLQETINILAVTADDTKRAYKRRVPKLVKLLNAFVTEMYAAKLTSTSGFTQPTAPANPGPVRFVPVGRTI